LDESNVKRNGARFQKVPQNMDKCAVFVPRSSSGNRRRSALANQFGELFPAL